MASSIPDRTARRVTGRVPVMSETRYDLVIAALISGAVGLGLLVSILIAIWLSNLLPTNTTLTPTMPAGDGGWEDGSPDETLQVESPEDPTDDPSLSNDQQEAQLEHLLEQLTMSDIAAQMVAPNDFSDPMSGGNPGSAEGTGGRPYGSGGGIHGGAKREQRWFVRFADKGDLKSYARQLDFFGIELGIAFRDGRIIYVSDLSTTPPAVRRGRVSSDEKRLFMNWQQGGDRINADRELLTNAGIEDVASGTILHFYPAATEELLARLEYEYARLKPEQIRRTYFDVKRDGNDFKFEVANQKRW